MQRLSGLHSLVFPLAVLMAAACGDAASHGATDSLGPAEALAAEPHVPRPPAPAARLDPDAQAWVEETLAGLSLRQRVAQLVVPWISGESERGDRREFHRMLSEVEELGVGGLIVSRGRPAVLEDKLGAAQRRAAVPLLVVSDLEVGPGMRLSPGGTDFPPAMAFGAADDEALAREAGRVTAAEARAVGIHLTLGPVLDVNSNPANPIINVRSFGEDPQRVARLATAWVEGAREGGLLSAGKHFPGHGDTEVDSHVGLATVSADSAGLERVELVPFRRALSGGIDAVLVGHLAVPALQGDGPAPASLSRRIVGDLLRDRMGFEGLVFTDAMNMGAIVRRHEVPEAAILALEAGVDVLLQPPGPAAVIEAVVAAVQSGRLSEERIERSVRRVLTAKATAGLHRPTEGVPVRLEERVGTSEHAAVAARVAQASITLAHDPAGRVPIRRGAEVLHLVYTRTGRGSAGDALQAELADGGVRVRRERVGSGTTGAAFARLRERAEEAELVLVTIAVEPRQYEALAVADGFAELVDGLASSGRPVVVVSLGTPYLLEALPSAPTLLLAWSDAAVSQRAAARALLGAAPIRGRLPVSLPPLLRVGDGLAR